MSDSTAPSSPSETSSAPTPLPLDSRSVGDRPGASIEYERFLDCVHCGLCTSACPTYLETGDENDSPRGRIYLMRSVVDGRLPLSEPVEKHLDLCLDCRSCETACPSGVQYGRLIEPFRVEQHKRPENRPGFLQRLLLHRMFPYPARMRWALLPARIFQRTGIDALLTRWGVMRRLPTFLQRMHHLLPKRIHFDAGRLPERLPAEGEQRARVVLFTGCVAETMFRHVHWATAKVLQANGCEVLIPRSQACCGAIHYHSGEATGALRFANTNCDAFDLENVDAVIVNVAGCGAMLKDYGEIAHEIAPDDEPLGQRMSALASKVRDVSEFLHELGPRPVRTPIPLTATYHDACHLVHAQGVREQPRALLDLIPELKLVSLTESDICCGAAGSYNLTQPEMADRLADRKRKNILATHAKLVVSGNAGCTLQMQASLDEIEHPIAVVHPMELLAHAYQPARKVRPTWWPKSFEMNNG